MGGGPIIIIDPDRVQSPLNNQDTIDRLRQVADALENGEIELADVGVIDQAAEE